MDMLSPSIPLPLPGTQVPVWQIVGRNAGPLTGPGTNSYLIGREAMCLVDPGPVDAVQLDVFLKALAGRELRHILVTHTHRDHSPGAGALAAATGADLIGLPAPRAPGQDRQFQPRPDVGPGSVIDCGEYRVQLIHTPGHVSNHLCYLLVEERLLFTGDHILEGTTAVILPPDGDMTAYLDSLTRLLDIPLATLAPGHGRPIGDPHGEIRRIIDHRLRREAKIFACLEELGPCDETTLARQAYADVDQSLLPWAMKTQRAHLIKLRRDGRAERRGERWRTLGGGEPRQPSPS